MFLKASQLKQFLIAGLFSVCGYSSAEAMQCLSDQEMRAQAAITIHSELMVTALNCTSQYPAKGLIQIYESFSRKHRDVLSESESLLIRYFKQNGQGYHAFDSYRTRVANNVSEQVFERTQFRFCREHVGELLAAASWSQNEFLKQIKVTSVTQTPQVGCSQQLQYVDAQ